MRNKRNRWPELFILAAATLWGLIGPFSVWTAREGLTAVETAFWRTALTALSFALLARGRLFRMSLADLGGSALFGATGIAVMYVAFFVAVQHSGVGIAAVLLYTGPAWVGIFEWTAARRRPGPASAAALLLTIAGVALVSYQPGRAQADNIGIIAGLISGVAYATHFILAPRYLLRAGAAPVYAIAMTVAALLIAPLARPELPPAGAWPPLLFLSLAATFVASLLFARGVVQLAPVRAAITATIEPVVANAAAILVLGARLTWLQLIGTALVLTGVTVIVIQRDRTSN